MRLSPSGRDVSVVTTEESLTANLTMLAFVPSESGADLVWVESLLCYFHRNRSSTAVPDGITVIPAVGGGVWERIETSSSKHWLEVATFWVDAVNGNDEYAGTLAAPLKTLDELSRRWKGGKLKASRSVVVLSDLTNQSLEWDVDESAGAVTISVSGALTVLASDVVASYIAPTYVLGTDTARLESTAILDWTPYVGKLVRVQGATEGFTWVAKVDPLAAADLKTARVSYPARLSGTTTLDFTPVAGNTFDVCEMFTLTNVSFSERGKEVSSNSVSLSFLRLLGCGASHDGSATVGTVCLVCDVRQPVANSTAAWRAGNIGTATFEGSLVGHPATSSGHSVQPACAWAISRSLLMCGLRTGLYAVRLTRVLLQRQRINGWHAVSLFGGPGVLSASFLFFADCDACLYFTNHQQISFDNPIGGINSNRGIVILENNNFPTSPIVVRWPTVSMMDKIQCLTADVQVRGSDFTWASCNYANDEQCGVATLVGGTVIVPARRANLRNVQVTVREPGGTPGILSVPLASRTATQFVIQSTEALDTSVVEWRVSGESTMVYVGPVSNRGAPS